MVDAGYHGHPRQGGALGVVSRMGPRVRRRLDEVRTAADLPTTRRWGKERHFTTVLIFN